QGTRLGQERAHAEDRVRQEVTYDRPASPAARRPLTATVSTPPSGGVFFVCVAPAQSWAPRQPCGVVRGVPVCRPTVRRLAAEEFVAPATLVVLAGRSAAA